MVIRDFFVISLESNVIIRDLSVIIRDFPVIFLVSSRSNVIIRDLSLFRPENSPINTSQHESLSFSLPQT
jgi:hypothetical protein